MFIVKTYVVIIDKKKHSDEAAIWQENLIQKCWQKRRRIEVSRSLSAFGRQNTTDIQNELAYGFYGTKVGRSVSNAMNVLQAYIYKSVKQAYF